MKINSQIKYKRYTSKRLTNHYFFVEKDKIFDCGSNKEFTINLIEKHFISTSDSIFSNNLDKVIDHLFNVLDNAVGFVNFPYYETHRLILNSITKEEYIDIANKQIRLYSVIQQQNKVDIPF